MLLLKVSRRFVPPRRNNADRLRPITSSSHTSLANCSSSSFDTLDTCPLQRFQLMKNQTQYHRGSCNLDDPNAMKSDRKTNKSSETAKAFAEAEVSRSKDRGALPPTEKQHVEEIAGKGKCDDNSDSTIPFGEPRELTRRQLTVMMARHERQILRAHGNS